MQTFAFVLPILPGKEEPDRQAYERWNSTDQDAYKAARRAQGFSRETIYHQPTPNGTLAIVVYEAEDVHAAMARIADSDAPFDVDFRAFINDIHGFNPAGQPQPDSRMISDMTF